MAVIKEPAKPQMTPSTPLTRAVTTQPTNDPMTSGNAMMVRASADLSWPWCDSSRAARDGQPPDRSRPPHALTHRIDQRGFQFGGCDRLAQRRVFRDGRARDGGVCVRQSAAWRSSAEREAAERHRSELLRPEACDRFGSRRIRSHLTSRSPVALGAYRSRA